MPPATSTECPCCHDGLAPGVDTDRALVIAFLGGVSAANIGVQLDDALCGRHFALLRECVEFLRANGGAF